MFIVTVIWYVQYPLGCPAELDFVSGMSTAPSHYLVGVEAVRIYQFRSTDKTFSVDCHFEVTCLCLYSADA